MSTQDPDLLATLTDEEREAMADDADDAAALAEIAGDASPATVTGTGNDDPNATDDDDDPPGDGQPVEGQGAAPSTPATTGDTPATTDQGEQPDTGDLPTERPQQYHAELPADFDEKWNGLTTRKAEIQQKFNDGEIELAERDAQLDTIQSDREAMLLQRSQVLNLQTLNEQNARQTWNNQIARFMGEAAKEPGGIDYRKDPEKAKDLDDYVKALAKRPENEDKDGPWFLREAHKRVRALHGMAAIEQAQTKTPAQRIAEARTARKPAISDVPQNLSAVPGSEGPGDVEGEFSHLDALEGQELEDAIASMTPTQRTKYLRS